MRTIGTVLATVRYAEADMDQLRTAFAGSEFVHCDSSDHETIRDVLTRADVAVLEGDLDDRFLAAPNLAWVHCDQAGLNGSAKLEVFARGLVVTGSAGRSAPAMAQHAFFFALGLRYDVRTLFKAQDARRWQAARHIGERRALWGQTLGVVGFGHTGQEMAKLGQAFGMRVMVYRRSCADASPYVDVMLSADAGDSLDPLVEEADVIMLAANLSDETYHLFGKAEFRAMKSTSVIINLSRGELIDEPSLVEALQAGHLAGAGLDVFEEEPLSEASPLWDLDNVILTPHATPHMPDKVQRSIDTIVENSRRYRLGEPLLNAITARDIYSHPAAPQGT